MTSLVEAYQSNHIDQFERVLRTHRRQIMGDTFIASHIEDLLRTLRTQVPALLAAQSTACGPKAPLTVPLPLCRCSWSCCGRTRR